MVKIIVKLEKYIPDDVYKLSGNKINEYLIKPGIWILLGKKFDEDLYTSLNVGKSKEMGREILFDIGCLNNLHSLEEGDRNYINQFGEYCGFKWKSGLTQEYLYPYIASEYKSLVFISVVNENNTNEELLAKEKKISEEYHALYWRNGKVYNNAVDDEFKKECMRYFDTIEDFINAFNEWEITNAKDN